MIFISVLHALSLYFVLIVGWDSVMIAICYQCLSSDKVLEFEW